ncbi:MAG: sugar phosphate isomerase/epimerase family protein [Pirellulaceae bacterium]
MRPALAQISTLNSPFDGDVREYAASQCSALEVWLTKLEDYLQTHSLDDTRQLLDREQMVLAAAAQQGGVLASQGEGRREAWQLMERRLQLLQQLGCPTLIVSCDVPAPLGATDADRVRVSLSQAADVAARYGVRLALEFQARSSLGNNLQTAAALVREAGHPHLGLCFDAFHYYVGPSKPDDLGLLTRDNLFHVQLCDVADVPRELAADGHRILPGDGDIPLKPVIDRLCEIGYEGYVSVELMNPRIWQIPPRQFSEIAMTAIRKLLGHASMSGGEN